MGISMIGMHVSKEGVTFNLLEPDAEDSIHYIPVSWRYMEGERSVNVDDMCEAFGLEYIKKLTPTYEYEIWQEKAVEFLTYNGVVKVRPVAGVLTLPTAPASTTLIINNDS